MLPKSFFPAPVSVDGMQIGVSAPLIAIKPKKTRKRLRQDAKPSNVKLLAIILGGFVPPPRALKGQGFP